MRTACLGVTVLHLIAYRVKASQKELQLYDAHWVKPESCD